MQQTDSSIHPSKKNRSNTHKVIFSGIQPSGQLHLGNYIGALRPWADDQHKYENFFCIVDMHALTAPDSVKGFNLRTRAREVTALYLACGIDPKYATIFIQSDVPEHTELMWLLNCLTPLGWLERMTQYKSKSKGSASIGTGLLTYPILQAADILLYQTDFVPVGDDQKQHIELTRDIAMKFNQMYGDVFKIPEAKIPATGARIMGLDDPTTKMSKSFAHTQPNHAIGLLDDIAIVRKKIMRAVTDSGSEVDPLNISDGVRNLLEIYASLLRIELTEAIDKFAGRTYGELKLAVANAVCTELELIQNRYKNLVSDNELIDEILEKSTKKARERAQRTLVTAKAALTLI